MALKLFLILFIMIFLLGVSQTNLSKENVNYLQMAKVLNQASEHERIKFFRSSFKSFDANRDGFVTSNEFNNVDFESLQLPFAYLASEAMTEALIQENENGVDPTKIGITFEDYKDALKMRLEQICGIS
jgi:Ca2+-binding EF-hand superfamily protein